MTTSHKDGWTAREETVIYPTSEWEIAAFREGMGMGETPTKPLAKHPHPLTSNEKKSRGFGDILGYTLVGILVAFIVIGFAPAWVPAALMIAAVAAVIGIIALPIAGLIWFIKKIISVV